MYYLITECVRQGNLILVMDASEKPSHQDWEAMVKGASEVIMGLEVSSMEVEVALVWYARLGIKHTSLGRLHDKVS